jgi:hypothetical protein
MAIPLRCCWRRCDRSVSKLAGIAQEAILRRSDEVNHLTCCHVMKRETLAIVKLPFNRLVKVPHRLAQENVRIPFHRAVCEKLHEDPISSALDSYAGIHQTAKSSDVRQVSR